MAINLLIVSIAFLLFCAGMAAIAAIPLLVSVTRKNHEVADNLNVATQITVNRYNDQVNTHNLELAKKKRPNLQPLKGGKDGDSQSD